MKEKSTSEKSLQFVDGKSSVLPFEGKYAVKDDAVFQKIRSENPLANDLTYYPLRMEIELTTDCNDTCSHCGMGAVKIGRGLRLSRERLNHIIKNLSECKIPSVALTGGEPLVYSDDFFYFIEQCTLNDIEIAKITTNGFWGTKKLTDSYLDKMASLGLTKNKYFVPLLSLSIGEQSTSLENLSRIIHAVVNKFTKQELNIGIWSMSEFGKANKVEKLQNKYEELYGTFPLDRTRITQRTYVFSPRVNFKTEMSSKSVSVYDMISNSYGCFSFTVGSNVLPTGLIKANGDFFTCSGFDVPNRLNFGNLYSSSLLEILKKIDSDPHVKLVKDRGLESYKDLIDEEKLKSVYVNSYCEACDYITKLLKI